MESIGLFDAKTHLSALVDRAARGETIQITKRGVPVAKLVPVQASSRRKREEAVRRIRELRKGLSLGGLKIRDLINEGRR